MDDPFASGAIGLATIYDSIQEMYTTAMVYLIYILPCCHNLTIIKFLYTGGYIKVTDNIFILRLFPYHVVREWLCDVPVGLLQSERIFRK